MIPQLPQKEQSQLIQASVQWRNVLGVCLLQQKLQPSRFTTQVLEHNFQTLMMLFIKNSSTDGMDQLKTHISLHEQLKEQVQVEELFTHIFHPQFIQPLPNTTSLVKKQMQVLQTMSKVTEMLLSQSRQVKLVQQQILWLQTTQLIVLMLELKSNKDGLVQMKVPEVLNLQMNLLQVTTQQKLLSILWQPLTIPT